MSDRVDRLRASLEEPLLVSDPTNLRYLTGFESSNAALLVEPNRLRLFADFRYAEGARALEGVEFEESKRLLYPDLATRLRGRIAFEPDALSYARYRVLADAGLELVPRSGLVERLRAVKDESELQAIRRASEITSEAYARLAEERFVGRTERELAWRMDVLLRELGGEGLAFPTHVNSGPNAARPHSASVERPIGPGETVIVDAGACVDGYCSDCTRTFATAPSGAPSTPRRASASPPTASARRSATGSATASASSSTRRPCCGPSLLTCSRRGASSPSSPGSTSPAAAESGSRTWWSSRTASPKC
jgi:Xaa-Pro aminopeptidase